MRNGWLWSVAIVATASCFSGSIPNIPCTSSSGCPTGQSCDGQTKQCTTAVTGCTDTQVVCNSICVEGSCPTTPATPVITAPAFVTASGAGYVASVPSAAGDTYAWTITGGTITAGSTTSSITFSAGASGQVGLGCVVTNVAGEASGKGTASSTIVPEPAVPVVAFPAVVTADQAGYTASVPEQAGATYVWTIDNGAITTGGESDAVTFTAGDVGTLQLSCIVKNQAGSASNAGTASISVIAAPATPVINGPANVTASTPGVSASVAAQPGSTYAWTIDNGTITSGETTSTVVFTPGPSGSVTLTCVVTNAAGTASAPGELQSSIWAAPTTPIITAPADVTANQAGYAASVPAQPGVAYAWTISGGAITSDPTLASITFTAGASGQVQLGCVATNPAGTASAGGTAASAIVAPPTKPVITAPALVSSNQSGYIATTSPQTASTYAWTVSNGAITAGQGTTSITFTAGTSGSVSISCAVTNLAGTTSDTGSAQSTIVALPNTPVIAAPAFVTADQANYIASVAAQPGTYAWTIQNGTITAGVGTNSITFTAGDAGVVSLGCIVSNTAGTSSPKASASIAIVAAPSTPVITAPAQVTASQSGYSASVVAQANSTYAWTLTGGSIISGATSTSIVFTAGASGNVQLSCVVTNAAGTASAAGTATSSIVNAPSTPVLTAPAIVTADQAGYVASVPAQANATYAWTITDATITAGAGSNSITFTPGDSGIVGLSCVVTNSAGTPSTAGTGTSTIVAPPSTPVVTAPAFVTANLGGYTATVPAQSGVTFAWSVSSNASITAGASTNSVTFTPGASGSVVLSCVATNAAGTQSAAGTASSTISPVPATPVITTPAQVTMNQSGYTASVPAQANTTYAWTITGGTINGGSTTNSISFTAGTGSSVGLSCVVTNQAGTSSPAGTASSAIISGPVNPVITAPAYVTANQGGYTASVPTQANSTYAWTISGGSFTSGATDSSVTFTPGASGTVSLTCIVTNASGTASPVAASSSTIVAAPATPAITAPANVTANQGGYAASVPAQSNSTYAWTISGGTISGGQGTASILFTAGSPGSLTLGCTVTNQAGTASNQGTASSTVVAAPATPVITAPAYVTAGQANYTASVPVQSGSTYSWSIAGGTITAGTSTASITFTAAASGSSSVQLGCTVVNAAGTSSTPATAVSSTIVAPPTTPAVTAPAFVTANQASYTASVTPQSNSTYAWTITGGTISSASTGASVTFTAGTGSSVGLSCVVTNQAGTPSTAGTGASTIVSAPTTPAITAPQYVTTGQANYTASITPQANSTYAWTITGGTLTSSNTGTSVTFTAGTGSSVGLTCIVTNQAGTASTAGAASSTTVSPPSTPSVTVPAFVTASQAGYAASVGAQPNSTYAWTITGGVINSGNGTSQVSFTPGTGSSVSLSCVVTNQAGTAGTAGSASSTIVAAPSVPSVSAPANVTANQSGYTASVTAQSNSTYSWTISGGTITAGQGTASITFTAGASGSVTLGCTVTNQAGTTSGQGTASSTIVAAPTQPTITAPAAVTAGHAGYTASVSAQSNSTYSWTISGGTFTNGSTTSSVTFTAGASGSVQLTCTVTNAAGTPSAAGNFSSSIYAAPTQPTVTAPANVTSGVGGFTASIPAQASSTYQWSINNGTITAGATSTSITFTPGSSGTVIVSCVVTNAASTSSSAGTASSSIVAAPIATSLVGSSSNPQYGATITLTPTFSYGTATIGTSGAGSSNVTASASSTTGVTSTPVDNTVVFTLTVTNAAGTQATTTLSVTSQVVTISDFGAFPRWPVNEQQTAQGSVLGAVNTTINWSVTAGSIVSGQGTNTPVIAMPSTVQTFSVTATAAADGVTSKTVQITTFPQSSYAFVASANTLSAYGLSEVTGEMYLDSTIASAAVPESVAVAPSGQYVYVSSGSNALIYIHSFNPATGALGNVGTIASGTTPSTIQIGPSGKYLYVNNFGSGTVGIYSINLSTGALTLSSTFTPTSGGAGSIAISPNGLFLYMVAGSGNNVSSYAIGSSGGLTLVNTVATGATPLNVTVAPSGLFAYVTNHSGSSVSVYSINQSTGALSLASTPATSANPTAIAFSYTGLSAYVTETSGLVQQFTVAPLTGALTSANQASTGANPVGLVVAPHGGFAYTTNYNDNTLSGFSLNVSTGQPTALSPTASTVFSGTNPQAIAISSTVRNAYVASGSEIDQYTLDPTSGTPTYFDSANGLAAAPGALAAQRSGRYIYIAEPTQNEIQYLSGFYPAAGAMGIQFSSATTGKRPYAMVLAPSDQFLYVVNATDATISTFQITANTGALTAVGSAIASGSSSNSLPTSVVVTPSGTCMYSTNYNDGTVSMYTVNIATGVLASAGSPIAAGSNPQAVTITPSGQFAYVVNYSSNSTSIYSINPTSCALTALSTASTGNAPVGIVMAPTGNYLYVSNLNDGTFAGFAISSTGALTGVGSAAGGFNAANLALSPNGAWGYSTGTNSSSIWSYTNNLATGVPTKLVSFSSQASSPVGVALRW